MEPLSRRLSTLEDMENNDRLFFTSKGAQLALTPNQYEAIIQAIANAGLSKNSTIAMCAYGQDGVLKKVGLSLIDISDNPNAKDSDAENDLEKLPEIMKVVRAALGCAVNIESDLITDSKRTPKVSFNSKGRIKLSQEQEAVLSKIVQCSGIEAREVIVEARFAHAAGTTRTDWLAVNPVDGNDSDTARLGNVGQALANAAGRTVVISAARQRSASSAVNERRFHPGQKPGVTRKPR